MRESNSHLSGKLIYFLFAKQNLLEQHRKEFEYLDSRKSRATFDFPYHLGIEFDLDGTNHGHGFCFYS